jgi:hypothetical protein
MMNLEMVNDGMKVKVVEYLMGIGWRDDDDVEFVEEEMIEKGKDEDFIEGIRVGEIFVRRNKNNIRRLVEKVYGEILEGSILDSDVKSWEN